VHRHCPRAGYYEEGVFAEEYGDKECLVELGCWGPVVQCNIAERGIVDGHGGCMNMGGICIGCTMPGFPDKFAPFYAAPPGSFLSGTTSRAVGGFIRRVRRLTMHDKQRSVRWQDDELPSGWARYKTQPVGAEKAVHRFYSKVQHHNDGANN
jgi:hydrogenase small subunit